jgi:hypothetical protein
MYSGFFKLQPPRRRRWNISDVLNAVPAKDGALATIEENGKEDDVSIAKISNVDARRTAAIIVVGCY